MSGSDAASGKKRMQEVESDGEEKKQKKSLKTLLGTLEHSKVYNFVKSFASFHTPHFHTPKF